MKYPILPAMNYIAKPEYELSGRDRTAIFELRKTCFPGYGVTNHYGKQLPTARMLAFDDGRLAGHIGCIIKVIHTGIREITVMGLQDVIVHPEFRRQGIMTEMIRRIEAMAVAAECRLMMLFAHEPGIYEALGFERLVVNMQWLKIHEGRNLGVGNEVVEETMIKRLNGFDEAIEAIDMLGHIF